MKVSEQRKKHKTAAQKLRRARHLYILFAKSSIQANGTSMLLHVAKRMLETGLYAVDSSPALKDTRFHILRHMWRIDGGKNNTPQLPNQDPAQWDQWCLRNGWKFAVWTFEKKTA